MFDCRLGDSETGGDPGFGKQPRLGEPSQELGKIKAYTPLYQGSHWLTFAHFLSEVRVNLSFNYEQ